MSQQGYDELILLNSKIDELLKRYDNLRTNNNELRNENEALKTKLQESSDKIKELETKYERIKLSGALMGGGENAFEAKKKITELVREIDRCVALLNR
jgi:predicted  nucleic acid-binding Zn-ribbon protein